MAVVDVIKPVASPELGSLVVDATRKMRETIYRICLLQNVSFQELVDEHEPTYGKSLLDFVSISLNDPPYNVESDCEDVHPHCDILTPECIANVAALRKQVTIPGPAAICFVLRYILVGGT